MGLPDADDDVALVLQDRLDEAQTEAVLAWTRAGGTLVVTDPASSLTPEVLPAPPSEDETIARGVCTVEALDDVEEIDGGSRPATTRARRTRPASGAATSPSSSLAPRVRATSSRSEGPTSPRTSASTRPTTPSWPPPSSPPTRPPPCASSTRHCRPVAATRRSATSCPTASVAAACSWGSPSSSTPRGVPCGWGGPCRRRSRWRSPAPSWSAPPVACSSAAGHPDPPPRSSALGSAVPCRLGSVCHRTLRPPPSARSSPSAPVRTPPSSRRRSGSNRSHR